MAKIFTTPSPVLANNLEDMLAQAGAFAFPDIKFALKFSEINQIGSTADNGYRPCTSQPITTTAGGTAFGVDTIRLCPFYVPVDTHIDRLAFVVTVAGGASSKARVGIYNSSPTPPYLPTTLVVDGGEFDTNASANGKIATIDVVLKGGTVYWAAYLCGTAAPTVFAFVTSFNNPLLGYQISNAATTVIASSGLSGGLAYGAFPANLQIAAASFAPSGNCPAVFYRAN